MVEPDEGASDANQPQNDEPDMEERFRIISELTSDFAYSARVEPGGAVVIEWVSDSVEKATGYAAQEIISRGLQSIVHPDDLHAARQHMDKLIAGRSDVSEFRIITSGGGVRWVREYARPVRDKDEARVVRLYAAAQDITEQKLTEEELRRKERELSDFVENAAVALHWVGRDGTILWANQAELDLLGYTREEYVGHNIAEFHADQAVIQEILDRLSKKETLHSFQARLKCKDGSIKHVLISSNVLWDKDRFLHTRCFTRDITQMKQAEQAKALLASIVESSDDAILSKDMDGIILSWNRGAERLYGYSAQEVVGRSVALLMPPERANDFPEIMGKLRRGEKVDHYETERVTKDGRKLSVSLTVSPIRDDAGNIVGASAIARNITDRKRADAERERLLALEKAARIEAETARKLSSELLVREQSARRAAEESSRTKDEFLATVSHELRTPLNAILGWSTMLNRSNPDEATTARAIEAIERNARAQAQLIDDLLDVSRIITGRMRLDVQPVELSLVIQAAVDAIRPAAAAKEIRLKMLIDPNAGPVSGDPGRLQQIIWNILSNAVKFTPKRGMIQVRLERVNSHVEVTISDTGQGIKPEVLPYIFDRFRQGDSSLSRVHGGLGLGLSIVRHLVELHGGTVEAQSAGEGYGATFIVSLPITITQNKSRYVTGALEMEEAAAGSEISNCPASLEGLRVLVVEDEPDARELLVTILGQCGAQVSAAASAGEGIELIQQYEPDVLISDIQMPNEDGYAFIKRVRSLRAEQGGQVPAIALTAHARTDDRLRALSAGFDAHVTKPMDPMELITVIASLARRTGRNESSKQKNG